MKREREVRVETVEARTGNAGWSALFALAAALAAVVVLTGCAPRAGENEPADAAGAGVIAEERDEAAPYEPSYTMIDADDLPGIFEEVKGRVAVVNFWATWCAPCLAEMPHFIEFHEKRPRDQVAFVSICADQEQRMEEHVLPYMRDVELPFHVHAFRNVYPNEVEEQLGIDFPGSLPVTLVLNEEGEVVRQWNRYIGLEELEAAVTPLLDDGSP